jgi:hypothetical protein
VAGLQRDVVKFEFDTADVYHESTMFSVGLMIDHEDSSSHHYVRSPLDFKYYLVKYIDLE